MRQDLTARLLCLGTKERELLQDIFQARFVTGSGARAFADLADGSLQELIRGGFLREVGTASGDVCYLAQTGIRAALALLGGGRDGGSRAYAALRLGHELRRADLYLALRRLDMPASAYWAEPRLAYRSAAGLGLRALVPDALVERLAGDALVEVDRGTEGLSQLRHKWLRYREWLEDAPGRSLYVLADDPARVLATLAAAGLRAEVLGEPQDLAEAIWLPR